MFEIISIEGGVSAPEGFIANGIWGGLKDCRDDLDMAYIYMEPPCRVHAHFTANAFKAAPIVHFLEFVEGKRSNFILINTKNANAMTGVQGVEDVKEILKNLCDLYPEIRNPIMSSTGVIGTPLPKEKIKSALSKINLNPEGSKSQAARRAARGIMTTDSFCKEIALRVDLEDGRSFTLGAMAKGAGMINPSLATMLCFVTTDAAIPEEDIESILSECIEQSFDRISVDGDMSTNDTVMLCANGLSLAYDKEAFKAGLLLMFERLAYQIVSDGEGSTRVVNFRITGARSRLEAKRVAKALSNSLLVKTAIFGTDPNWGRIASTIGACGAKSDTQLQVACDELKLKIRIAGFLVYDCGKVLFSPEIEDKIIKAMKKEDFEVHCDLGVGEGDYYVLGCDLGYEYVRVNSYYRS